MTFYTWTSDQLSQYGIKVSPSTIRDATYVLDAILNNETELPILEHTTDTAGFTDLIFALFDLLGLRFSPRLRDIGALTLYRLESTDLSHFPKLKDQVTGVVRRQRILERWDDMLRLAGSLKLGWVTTSLFVQKLQAFPQQNALTRVLQEYGRLIRTLHILRWYDDQDGRRRINRQLNKGEAIHSLRSAIRVANKGELRRKQEEALTNQAGCLNLVTNAVILWNTVYMAAAVEQLKEEGYPVQDSDLAQVWPTRHAPRPYQFLWTLSLQYRGGSTTARATWFTSPRQAVSLSAKNFSVTIKRPTGSAGSGTAAGGVCGRVAALRAGWA